MLPHLPNRYEICKVPMSVLVLVNLIPKVANHQLGLLGKNFNTSEEETPDV